LIGQQWGIVVEWGANILKTSLYGKIYQYKLAKKFKNGFKSMT